MFGTKKFHKESKVCFPLDLRYPKGSVSSPHIHLSNATID